MATALLHAHQAALPTCAEERGGGETLASWECRVHGEMSDFHPPWPLKPKRTFALTLGWEWALPQGARTAAHSARPCGYNRGLPRSPTRAPGGRFSPFGKLWDWDGQRVGVTRR